MIINQSSNQISESRIWQSGNYVAVVRFLIVYRLSSGYPRHLRKWIRPKGSFNLLSMFSICIGFYQLDVCQNWLVCTIKT